MQRECDTPQKKLSRIAWYFDEVGIYTKANYCHEIIDYIDSLEKEIGDEEVLANLGKISR